MILPPAFADHFRRGIGRELRARGWPDAVDEVGLPAKYGTGWYDYDIAQMHRGVPPDVVVDAALAALEDLADELANAIASAVRA